jgi:hypothetical protein
VFYLAYLCIITQSLRHWKYHKPCNFSLNLEFIFQPVVTNIRVNNGTFTTDRSTYDAVTLLETI